MQGPKILRDLILCIFISIVFLGVYNFSFGATIDVCKKDCAYSKISDAIEASHNGDIIRIAAGTYTEPDIFLENKFISLEGGWVEDFNQKKVNPESTIIHGNIVVSFGQNSVGSLNFSNLTIKTPVSKKNSCIRIDVEPRGSDLATVSLSSVVLKKAAKSGLEVRVANTQNVSIILSNCLIFSNNFGITVESEIAESASKHIFLTIKNSTVANNKFAGIRLARATSFISNSIIYGNYFKQQSSYTTKPVTSADIILGPDANVTVDHSLYGNSIKYENSFLNIEGRGNLIGVDKDPLFRDLTEPDFHLSAQSPCIDQGNLTTGIEKDFEGDDRPIGNGIDMGADEYNPCIDDNVPPDQITGLGYDIEPFEIIFHWDKPKNNPYDYLKFFKLSTQGEKNLISELGPGQQSLAIKNVYKGESLTLRVIATDKCGNDSPPLDVVMDVPQYQTLYCPGGAFGFPDLSAKTRLTNVTDGRNRYFIYGFDENGTILWKHSEELAPHASQEIIASKGISSAIYTSNNANAFVEMDGTNGTSATYVCSSNSSPIFFLPENVCSDDWWSGVLIFNPSPVSANVTADFNPALVVPAPQKITIPPMGSSILIPPCQALSGTLNATSPVVAMQIVGNTQEMGMDIGAMLLPSTISDAYYLAGINDGISAWTGFAIYIPYHFSGRATIHLRRFSNSRSWDVPLAQVSSFSRKAFNLSETGIDGMGITVMAHDNKKLGSAAMVIQSSLSGFDLFNPGKGGIENGFVLGFDTAAANKIHFFNPESYRLNIRCRYYDAKGSLIRNQIVTVPPLASSTLLIEGAKANGLSFMEFVSERPVYGFMERETSNSIQVLPFLNAN